MNNIQRFVRSYITCRQTEHVRVEETACVFRHAWFPTNSGTNMRVGVRRHAHTVSGEAEADTQIALAFLNSGSHRVSKIREVTVLHRVATEIYHLGSLALQIQLNHRFQTKTSVVTCHSNGQFIDWFHIIILLNKNVLANTAKRPFLS